MLAKKSKQSLPFFGKKSNGKTRKGVRSKVEEKSAKQSVSANPMRSPLISSLRGPQARGNPNGLSAPFAVPENGTAVWIATALRASQ
jgi:hypothetical protein